MAYLLKNQPFSLLRGSPCVSTKVRHQPRVALGPAVNDKRTIGIETTGEKASSSAPEVSMASNVVHADTKPRSRRPPRKLQTTTMSDDASVDPPLSAPQPTPLNQRSSTKSSKSPSVSGRSPVKTQDGGGPPKGEPAGAAPPKANGRSSASSPRTTGKPRHAKPQHLIKISSKQDIGSASAFLKRVSG